MVDWSELPGTMVALIARHIHLIEDFVAFRRTCSSWREATSLMDFDMSYPRLPLLMLGSPVVYGYHNKDVDEREFFSLSKSKTYKFSLHAARWMDKFSVSIGWLIIMHGSSHTMSLLHPITRVQIRLPTHPEYCDPFKKAVLSASPSDTSMYVLMIVCTKQALNPASYMGFWKPGDPTWTQVEVPESPYLIDDVNYYNGKFYALTSPSQILMYDVMGPNPKKATKIIDLPWDMSRPYGSLVECAGRLVVVAAYKYNLNAAVVGDLEMVELDVIKGTYTNITSLGNSAVFLRGYMEGGGFSIDATRFPGVLEANYIYFSNGHYRPAICGRIKLKMFGLSGVQCWESLVSAVWVNFSMNLDILKVLIERLES